MTKKGQKVLELFEPESNKRIECSKFKVKRSDESKTEVCADRACCFHFSISTWRMSRLTRKLPLRMNIHQVWCRRTKTRGSAEATFFLTHSKEGNGFLRWLGLPIKSNGLGISKPHQLENQANRWATPTASKKAANSGNRGKQTSAAQSATRARAKETHSTQKKKDAT